MLLKFADSIINFTGAVVPLVTVSVFESGTENLVSIYTNESGNNASQNPFISGDTEFYFFVKPGQYDLRFQKDGELPVVDKKNVWILSPIVKNWVRTGVYYPLYIWLGLAGQNDIYKSLINLLKSFPDIPFTGCMNPGSGPGTAPDPEYSLLIEGLKGAKARVSGYISTKQAGRLVSIVKAEIQRWYDYYDVDLIHFDEVTSSATLSSLDYYREAVAYANSKGLGAVGNPGVPCDKEFYGFFQKIIAWENSRYPTTQEARGTEFVDPNHLTSRGQRIVLVHGQNLEALEVRNLINHYGDILVTNDTGGNPWDTVSPDLNRLFAMLSLTGQEVEILGNTSFHKPLTFIDNPLLPSVSSLGCQVYSRGGKPYFMDTLGIEKEILTGVV